MPARTVTHKRRDGARLFDLYSEIFRKRTILTTIIPHWLHQHHQCHHHHHPHHPKCNDCIGKNGNINKGSEKGKGMDTALARALPRASLRTWTAEFCAAPGLARHRIPLLFRLFLAWWGPVPCQAGNSRKSNRRGPRGRQGQGLRRQGLRERQQQGQRRQWPLLS